MPKRSYAAASGYRYGFNGKENDNDVKGLGNQQDYGNRIYDPRIGRFLSMDPITDKYPELTPYQFASNTPIWATDLDGLEANFSNAKIEKDKYVDYGMGKFFNFLGNGERFRDNVGKSAYNQLIDAGEAGVNLFSGKGRQKIMDESITPRFNGVIEWNLMSPEQKLTALKQFSSDPNNWEELGGSVLLMFGPIKLPKIKVPTFLQNALSPFTRLAENFKLATATTKISFYRDILSIKKTQNIAFLEGQVGNSKIFDIAVSGENAIGTVGNPSKRFFKTSVVKGYNRAFDSEVKLLENFAKANKGNTQISGTLTITSERTICASCDEVIEQFKNVFPNIKIEIIHGIKK